MSSFLAALQTHLRHPQARIFLAFFLLGVINNVLYVIILSAALDLVGPSIPKSLVLLFDVAPAFALKLVAPYFIHRIRYARRVVLCVLLAAGGMLLVALTADARRPGPAAVALKMAGIALASLASGAGELSFLALTSFYGSAALAAWGSGTGGAGLLGAGAYMLATTGLGLSVRASLLVFSFLPLVMLGAYFVVLPGREGLGVQASEGYAPVASQEGSEADDGEEEGQRAGKVETPHGLVANLRRARMLLVPYMLPLFLVYLAEYTINQGITPTLQYSLDSSPFKHYRDFYPAYGFIYQAGVFVSRSSLPFLRVQSLYIPSLLQVLNVALLTVQALTGAVLPNVWLTFAVIFWEGLLGGLVYVSAFRRIGEEVPASAKEFSLAATTVSDSAGILLASFIGMGVETGLCRWQVQHGKDWCLRL